MLQQIEHFFKHYKDLESEKWVRIGQWGDAEEAKRIVVEAIEAAKQAKAAAEAAGLGKTVIDPLKGGIAELEGVPEAGWAFDADHWGAGYATEAMTAALGWADGHLDAKEVRCIIDPGNAASERVAAKLGFARIGDSDALGGVVAIYSRPKGG